MERRQILERVFDVAREQAGYISTKQSRRLGISPTDLQRLEGQAVLRRVARGIYALPGVVPGPREGVVAAWLRLAGSRLPTDDEPPAATASHATAADLHGFGTLPPAPPMFTVSSRRFRPPDGSLRVHTAHLAPEDWEWVALPEGIRLPVTTPARTVVDLAFSGEDRGHVLDAIADARDAGSIDDAGLADALGRRKSRGGRGSVDWLARHLGSHG